MDDVFTRLGVPSGIRTRVLALKGCYEDSWIIAERQHCPSLQPLSKVASVTVLHALSPSDYLDRAQKRSHCGTHLLSVFGSRLYDGHDWFSGSSA
jgi:hypothetical protein